MKIYTLKPNDLASSLPRNVMIISDHGSKMPLVSSSNSGTLSNNTVLVLEEVIRCKVSSAWRPVLPSNRFMMEPYLFSMHYEDEVVEAIRKEISLVSQREGISSRIFKKYNKADITTRSSAVNTNCFNVKMDNLPYQAWPKFKEFLEYLDGEEL